MHDALLFREFTEDLLHFPKDGRDGPLVLKDGEDLVNARDRADVVHDQREGEPPPVPGIDVPGQRLRIQDSVFTSFSV